jgi:hypothetical protein
MAGTSFSQIFDSFTMLASDYKLTILFNQSPTDFATYLSGWLLPAIQEFGVCDQDLSYDTSTQTFTSTLTDKNIIVLARLMEKYWLQKTVDDLLQINLHVLDKDFRMASESANLQAKKSRLNDLKEELSQMLVKYSIDYSTNWKSWFVGTFYPTP